MSMPWMGWGWGVAEVAQGFKYEYRKARTVLGLLSDDKFYRKGFSSYFANVVQSKLIDQLQCNESCREDVYQRILGTSPGPAGDQYRDFVLGVASLLAPRAGGSLGWVAITGRPGYGSGTVGQYLSYLWSLHDETADTEPLDGLPHAAQDISRQLTTHYDLVLKIQCRLLGRSDMWNDVEDQSSLGYMVELIHKSVDSYCPIERRNIKCCIEDRSNRILFILDGFDEVKQLYGADPVSTAVIDTIMSFDSGIITAKVGTIPEAWMDADRLRVVSCYELIGFTRTDSRRYIECFFSDKANIAKLILSELEKNESMMRFSMVPINCEALCVTWDADSSGMMTCGTQGSSGSTLMLHRIVVWLTLRYGLMFKISKAERRTRVALTAAAAHDVCRRCMEELYGLSQVAYESFKTDDLLSQGTISDTLLARHFPRDGVLRRVVATMGLVKAGDIHYIDSDDVDKCYTYSTSIRFVHQCYYEYFVALYIVETLKADHAGILGIDSASSKADILSVLKKNNGRYVRVKQYLAGLCMLPEYVSVSGIVWATILTCTCAHSNIRDLPCVGVHSSFRILMTNADAIHEAMKSYSWLKYKCLMSEEYEVPPLLLRVFKFVFLHAAWVQFVSQPILGLHNDYPDDTTAIHIQEVLERRKNILLQTGIRAGFTPYCQTNDVTKLLSIFPAFSSAMKSCFNKIRFGASINIRLDAIAALRRADISNDNAVTILRDGVQDDDYDIRFAAAQALSRINKSTDASLEVLRSTLLGADEKLRQRAAFLLGSVSTIDPLALDPLRCALNSESWTVRCATAESLGRINNDDANVLAILGDALMEEDNGTRLLAIRTVGRIRMRNESIISLVSEAAHDEEWHVAVAAIETLSLLGVRIIDSLPYIHSMITDKDLYKRALACELLGKLGVSDKMSLSLLKNSLDNEEWAVRYAAAESLCMLTTGGKNRDLTKAAMDVFGDAARNSEWTIRFAAVEALGRRCASIPNVIDLLVECSSDPVKHVRVAAADAIGKLGFGDAKIAAILQHLTFDDYWNVRRASVEALGRICLRDKTSMSALQAALRDCDMFVRRAAALALRHVVLDCHDDSTIKALLGMCACNTDTALDLDFVHSVHTALLRIPPHHFLHFFKNNSNFLSDNISHRFFLLSLWLHGGSLVTASVDSAFGVLLGSVFYALPCDCRSVEIFIEHLQEVEEELLLTLDCRTQNYDGDSVNNSPGNFHGSIDCKCVGVIDSLKALKDHWFLDEISMLS